MRKTIGKQFFESLGGQTHARCACKTYPLIPTNRSNADKLSCNVKFYTSADGDTTEIDECNRKEAYVCSNPLCNTRMCRRCFNKLPTDQMTTVAGNQSPQEQMDDNKSLSSQDLVDDEEEDSGEMEVNGIQINEEQGENESIGDDSSAGEYESIGDDSSAGGSCLLTSGQDPTLDITQDNYHEPVGFLSTHAGDMPLNIEQSTTGESVAGHVIFNQLGNCICCLRGNIFGSS